MPRIPYKISSPTLRLPAMFRPASERRPFSVSQPNLSSNSLPKGESAPPPPGDSYASVSGSEYKSKEPLKSVIFAECVDGKIQHPPLLKRLRSIHPLLGKSANYSFPRNMGLEPGRMAEEIRRQHGKLSPRFTIVAPHTQCAGDPDTPVGFKMNDLVTRVSDSVQQSGNPHMILGGKIWGGHKRFDLRRVVVSDLKPLKTPENQEHLKMYETALENIRKRFPGVKIETVDPQGNIIASERTPRKVTVKSKKPTVRMPKRHTEVQGDSQNTSSGKGSQRSQNGKSRPGGNTRTGFQDANKALGYVVTAFASGAGIYAATANKEAAKTNKVIQETAHRESIASRRAMRRQQKIGHQESEASRQAITEQHETTRDLHATTRELHNLNQELAATTKATVDELVQVVKDMKRDGRKRVISRLTSSKQPQLAGKSTKTGKRKPVS